MAADQHLRARTLEDSLARAETRCARIQDELSETRDLLLLSRLEAEEAVLEREEAEEKYNEVCAQLATLQAANKQRSLTDGEEERLVEALIAVKRLNEEVSGSWAARHGAAEASATAAVAWGVVWRESCEHELRELRERSADRESATKLVEVLTQKNAALQDTESKLRMRLQDIEEEAEVLRDLDELQADEVRWLSGQAAEATVAARRAREEVNRLAVAAAQLKHQGDALREWTTVMRVEHDAKVDRMRALEAKLEEEDKSRKVSDALHHQPSFRDDASGLLGFLASRVRRLQDPGELELLVEAAVADAQAYLELAKAARHDDVGTALSAFLARCGINAPRTVHLAAALTKASRAATVARPALDKAVAMTIDRQLPSVDDRLDDLNSQNADDDDFGLASEILNAAAGILDVAKRGGIPMVASIEALAELVRSATSTPCGPRARALAWLVACCERGDTFPMEIPTRCRGDDARLETSRVTRREAQSDAAVAAARALDEAIAAKAASDARRVEAYREFDAKREELEELQDRRRALDRSLDAALADAASIHALQQSALADVQRLEADTGNLRRALRAKPTYTRSHTNTPERVHRTRSPAPRSPRRQRNVQQPEDTNVPLLGAALHALFPPLPRQGRAPDATSGDPQLTESLLTQARTLKAALLIATKDSVHPSSLQAHTEQFLTLKQQAAPLILAASRRTWRGG